MGETNCNFLGCAEFWDVGAVGCVGDAVFMSCV